MRERLIELNGLALAESRKAMVRGDHPAAALLAVLSAVCMAVCASRLC